MLNILWFLVLGILLIGYAILDGFDLGAGIIHLTARKDVERRIILNAIGPVWDGNEVWLITFGGALFAAFPNAYATAFSGLYVALMMVLCGLIFRAVSLEFRTKVDSDMWKSIWDGVFSVSSTVVALLLGVAVGNVLQGVPVGADGELHVSLLGLLTPFPLFTGILCVILFALHGTLYLLLKTENDFQHQLQRLAKFLWGIFAILYVIVSGYAIFAIPEATRNFPAHQWLWFLPVLNTIVILNMIFMIQKHRYGLAFVSSCVNIVVLVSLLGAALFPDLLISNIDQANNLNIYNAASSQKTLRIMTVILIIGMPLVVAYSIFIYRTFRGKVDIRKHLVY